MPPNEALMALDPQATSKLRAAENLHTLLMVGFRSWLALEGPCGNLER
ncbi:MAG: hypothetical protein ACFB21_13685 [Opitutales bacterium]